MARHKSFTLSKSDKEPITFEIADEAFTCIPVAPAGVFTDFVAGVTEMGAQTLPSLLGFVRGVLIDEDVERWDYLIHQKDVQIPIEIIVDIVQFLTEEYTGRPFVRASSSEAGPSKTGTGATDDSPSQESTPAT